MEELLAIGVAGGMGSVARFYLSKVIQQWLGQSFPFGILCVNVLGCLLMGLLATYLLERTAIMPIWRATILIGFLGGFTTFSSFTNDSINLFLQGDYFKAGLYILLSVILCLTATGVGVWLVRK